VSEKVAIWLGTTSPQRSIRWLDGALATGAKLADGADNAIALAAGKGNWLDLAADRARHADMPSAGIATELRLDYLGWAQVVTAAVRELGASTVIVDEASSAERWVEVAAIAEMLDAVQLTHVVKLSRDQDDDSLVRASRASGRELQIARVRGPAVYGVRIAGAPVDEYPTPLPSKSMRKLTLEQLGLDSNVLGHRSQAPRTSLEPRKTVERIGDHLVVHLAREGR
jgi:hypothetical protein